jgi:hypothetical protein
MKKFTYCLYTIEKFTIPFGTNFWAFSIFDIAKHKISIFIFYHNLKCSPACPVCPKIMILFLNCGLCCPLDRVAELHFLYQLKIFFFEFIYGRTS